MATEAQVAANRVNGLKGGVKTEAGKAVSRLNARKHGIFASALTECASDGFFAALLGELIAEIKPVGIVEQLLVDKLAVTYLRMRRCAEAETLHFRSHWKFNPANFGKFPHNETVVTLGLYDARLTKQFLRLLHEIEQRQKMRTAQRDHPQITQIPQITVNEEREDEQESPEGSVQNTGLDSHVCAGDVCSAGYQPATCEESQAEAPVPHEMKNEPNPAVSPAEPPATSHETLDSRLRGNDELQAAAAESGQADAPPQEMKNEPNPGRFPNAGRRMPNADQEMKNEPNLSQVLIAAGGGNSQ